LTTYLAEDVSRNVYQTDGFYCHSSVTFELFEHKHKYGVRQTQIGRVVNIAILKVLQYYWQYFFGYCLHIANTF